MQKQDCLVSWIDWNGVEERIQELACAEKWLHQDRFIDLLAEIGFPVQLRDCLVRCTNWDGVERRT